MQASVLTEVLLPLALAFVMFGMGLTLTLADFARLVKSPKPVVLGLIGQLTVLPLLAYFLCWFFSLPPHIAVGVMVLAACPGGTTSNLISHLVKANLALSVSLTALSTLACVFTTPFIIQFAIETFVKQDVPAFSMLHTVGGLVGISLFPVAIGMTLRHLAPEFAQRSEGFFRQFSLYFMLFMIAGVLISERESLAVSFKAAFLVCFILNLSSLLLGGVMAKVFGLAIKDALTLSIEIGVQNAALAMLICITFLNAPDYAIAAGVYGITMYIGPGMLAFWVKKRGARQDEKIKTATLF